MITVDVIDFDPKGWKDAIHIHTDKSLNIKGHFVHEFIISTAREIGETAVFPVIDGVADDMHAVFARKYATKEEVIKELFQQIEGSDVNAQS